MALQHMPTPVDGCSACAGDDEQPLIRAAMAILGPTFTVSRSNDHLCGLYAPITHYDSEATTEAQRFLFHDFGTCLI